MIKVQPVLAAFRGALQRLAELQKKTMREVILDQAALFIRDGMKLLPPFGKTPLKESATAQKRVGELATGRDVGRAFGTLNPDRTDIRMVTAFRNTARKHGPLAAERLLQRFKFKRVAGVIDSPSEELHNAARNERGRVSRKQPRWFTWKDAALTRFKKAKEKAVGRAKAGFLYALMQVDAMRGKSTFRAPSWVARHTGEPGAFTHVGSDDKFGITASNNIPFAQKHTERVEREGWRARMIAAPRQAENLYRGMVRQAQRTRGIR